MASSLWFFLYFLDFHRYVLSLIPSAIHILFSIVINSILSLSFILSSAVFFFFVFDINNLVQGICLDHFDLFFHSIVFSCFHLFIFAYYGLLWRGTSPIKSKQLQFISKGSIVSGPPVYPREAGLQQFFLVLGEHCILPSQDLPPQSLPIIRGGHPVAVCYLSQDEFQDNGKRIESQFI